MTSNLTTYLEEKLKAFDEKFKNHGFYPGVREVHHEFLTHSIQEAYLKGIEHAEGVVRKALDWNKHAKAYADGENVLAKENKSGWNSAIERMKTEALSALSALKASVEGV